MPVSSALSRGTRPSPLSFPTAQSHLYRRLRRHHKLRPKHPVPLRLPPPKHGCNLVNFRSSPLPQVAVANFCYGGLEINADEILELGDRDLPVDLCLTRTLPPALTLSEGYEKIGKAVENLKANPPCASSGVLRYQVLVPPSTKALKWLCCQCRDLPVYPQFYFSVKHLHEPTSKLSSLDRLLEVAGFGAAVCVYSSSDTKGYTLLARYLSVDSPLIRAYGFIGLTYNRALSLLEEKSNSFYFFIPQIELNEFGGCCILASTVIWDDALSFTVEKAVHNFKSYFYHVYLDAEILAGVDARATCTQKERLVTSHQSYIRSSPTQSLGTNMQFGSFETPILIKECSNINMVWASLIIEECVRLGLMYFCIAPGSRSSPLAISASSHSSVTCISCYDERSLGFHAVGYARGSNRPAVVITSSGTAVSNLLPAVVEASQDFVPLILLTADRPPELHDVGANQAIDQVNHYGKFVRFFFSLPPPTDQIPARMVVTTIDSAAYFSMQDPQGPVHINCPFREPLEDLHTDWTADCLRGLDLWLTTEKPYTRYIRMQGLSENGYHAGLVMEALEVIQRAEQGILLIGAIKTDDEMWAAALLAKHLSWPVVADILSGLRLRRALTSFPELENDFLFLDHMDHALLSDSVKSWAQPDVIVQIGGRITSKRICQFLEFCLPSSYVLVNEHPFRHDPSHIVTHRIQSTITDFAVALRKSHLPKKARRWNRVWSMLNSVVALDITFQIHAEFSLTEPYVAQAIGEVFDSDAAVFVGNSMVIRDLDMYGRGWLKSGSTKSRLMAYKDLYFGGIRISGNRGASGIDGLLSTAIGFAVGCNKKVFCVIGDVSFLHDTNGLSILNQRARRKPLTIIVVNNHGGAIFSLLPIASMTQPDILNKFFYTSHDISVAQLCAAHRVKHSLVRTKLELQAALAKSEQGQTDCVIEVRSCIADNACFHRILSKSSCHAATQALSFVPRLPFSRHVENDLSISKINKTEYILYRIHFWEPPTSLQTIGSVAEICRDGFILKICMDDNSIGFGEVAPLEIDEENLLDVEAQLRFLLHKMNGAEISVTLPMLNGSFSQWIWRSLGVPPSSIFPCVRCGVEMAILNALAAQRGSGLLDVTKYVSFSRDGQPVTDEHKDSACIQICGLVDCSGSPTEVAQVVSQLANEGFTTIKLKVARRESPIEDAAVIQKIRETVGYMINIRVDANRKWTYEEAMLFGSSVKNFNLQYIEEPICSEHDIIKFCEDSGLPVALDETIAILKGDINHELQKFVHPGIVALVIKPSCVGGFEKAALIAKWAHLHGKMAVVSSAFESSLSLSAYVQLAHFLELQNATVCRNKNEYSNGLVAHGLGTYRWLKKDITAKRLKMCVHSLGEPVEASVEDAHSFVQCFQVNSDRVQRTYTEELVKSYFVKVGSDDFSCLVKLQEAGSSINNKVVVFLHGFLGTSGEWIPIMKAISLGARSISVDLPGHGESQGQWHTNEGQKQEFTMSIESIANILLKLICDITDRRVVLVGYSMGARIALHMALNSPGKIDGAVIISGSPGLTDERSSRVRREQDKSRAYLLSAGLECFLETWYSGNLWTSLREHPHFEKVLHSRAKHTDIKALANVLCDSSIGRQRSLWEDLKHCKKPLLFIVGEMDTKFKEISLQMCKEIRGASQDKGSGARGLCEMVVVPDSGHAVHLENPLPVIKAVRMFLTNMERTA